MFLREKLHTTPLVRLYDRRVLAFMDNPLVADLADVERVGEDLVDVPARHELPAVVPARLRHAALRPVPQPLGLLRDEMQRPMRLVKREERPDRIGLRCIDGQCPARGIVAERHVAPHPEPLPL